MLRSYSQDKEDLYIDKLLGGKAHGFYVDVGAYHPKRFNNTHRFYSRGWRGINIEPNYEKYLAFTVARPQDVNLNIGISTEAGEGTLYKMFPDTLSTFSKEIAQSCVSQGYTLCGTQHVELRTLSDVLHEFAPNTSIDFLTIDTEGFDLLVLQSNDWKMFKPTILCVERVSFGTSQKNFGFSVEDFLLTQGYKKVRETCVNSIYKLNLSISS